MEMAEDIRHTLGNRAIYELRKETIERIFGTAKEQHGFRYTQYIGSKEPGIICILFSLGENGRNLTFNTKAVLEINSNTSFVYSLKTA